MTDINFRSNSTIKLHNYMGNDDAIIQAMLVSTQGDAARDAAASYGRIDFLMRNRHGTPFEHAAMTFFAEVPIFVIREWHRHRIGMSYNEMSGRYTQLPPTYYIPGRNRPLLQIGKPGAYQYVAADTETYDWLVHEMKAEACENYASYEVRLAKGIAKEVARMSLGVNIFTAQFFTCNPRSLMSFLSLRTKDEQSKFPSYPMFEIEAVALEMERIFADLFPLTYESFVNNGRVAP